MKAVYLAHMVLCVCDCGRYNIYSRLISGGTFLCVALPWREFTMTKSFEVKNVAAWLRGLSLKRCLGYGIVLALFGLIVYRAAHQSIAHDEAVSYNLFAAFGPQTILLTFHSNNHTLGTFLMWLSTTLFGLSVFAVRLPALLGALIYLSSAERLCNLAFKKTAFYALALLVLTASPFLLDYLSMARGYSLALGFMLLAVYYAWKRAVSVSPAGLLHEAMISIVVALSVSANLSFAFPNAALLLACAVLVVLRYVRKELSGRKLLLKILMLGLPGGMCYFLTTPSIINFSRDTLYYGTGSWRRTIESLFTELFDGFRPALLPVRWQEPVGNLAQALPYGFAILVVAALFVLLPKVARPLFSGPAPEPADVLWALLLLDLVFSVLLLSAARLFFGSLLPRERTGIYLVPLFLLLLCLSVAGCQKPGWQRVLRVAGQACLVLSVAYFGLSLRVSSFRETPYDSGMGETFQALMKALEQYPGSRVAADWLFQPSLNFYRTMYRVKGLNRFTRRAVYSDYRLLILLPSDDTDRQYIHTHRVKVLYTNPDSGAVLLLNNPSK